MGLIEILQKTWTIFGITAPCFSWVAAFGLIIFTFGYLFRIVKRLLYKDKNWSSVIREIKSLQKPNANIGLSLKTYNDIEDIFSKTPSLSSAWKRYKESKVIKRVKSKIIIEDSFWATESADSDFSETSLIFTRFNKSLIASTPGLVTGLGLFFTFLAILVALFDVKQDPNGKIEGIGHLIEGLSGKFVSSVAALFSASIFILLEKKFFYKFNKRRKELITAIDELFPRLTPMQVSLDNHREIAEQSNTLKLFSSDLALKLGDKISENITPTLNRMIEVIENLSPIIGKSINENIAPALDKMSITMENLNLKLQENEKGKNSVITSQLESLLEKLETSISSAINDMAKSFQKSLSGTTNNEFDKITNALQKTSSMLDNITAQFMITQSDMSKHIKLAKESNEKQLESGQVLSKEIISAFELSINKIKGMIDDMSVKNANIMTQVSGLSTSAVQNNNEQMKKLTNISSDLMDKITITTDSNVNKMTASLTGTLDNFSFKVLEMTKVLIENTKKTTEPVSEIIDKADKLIENHQAQIELSYDLNNSLKSSLTGFNDTLNKYSKITTDVKQVIDNIGAAVKQMNEVANIINNNQESLEKIADLTKEQIEGLAGSNEDQKEIWEGIHNSMTEYGDTFNKVNLLAKGLLSEIDSNITEYTKRIEGNFEKLATVSNKLFGDAVERIANTVDVLDDKLDGLNNILDKFLNK
ncbi:MAG: hypothetical protein HQK91_03280 [Nitrospirae bacterium]|nr:hypothetical protein [Nitrospirota bacterium]